jgi:homospermidine synthase
MGFVAEALDPVQVGFNPGGWFSKRYGTGFTPPSGLRNIRYYPFRGMERSTESLVITPSGKEEEYYGYLIPHGEANTLSSYLTSSSKTTKYTRPDVYYVYCPSFPARESIQYMRDHDYAIPRTLHPVLTLPQLKSGYESIGAYLMFSSPKFAWWTGTVLSISQVKKLGLKYAGPTEVQVAISLMACVRWMLKNKNQGVLSPEELPHSTIIEWCRPYLGNLVSRRVRNIHQDLGQ